MNTKHADSVFVRKLKQLIDLVDNGSNSASSLTSQASHYFSTTPALKDRIAFLAEQIKIVSETQANIKKLEELTRQYKKCVELLAKEQAERQHLLSRIVTLLLELCEDDTFNSTQIASARCLGSLMLLTPGAGSGYARYHARIRPVYKAILALRLMDKVLADDALKHPYLSKHQNLLSRFVDEDKQTEWIRFIAFPIIIAVLSQDIGLQHEAARNILSGEDNKLDPFRVLDSDERKKLLKINYQYTMTFLHDGIGSDTLMSPEAHKFTQDIVQDTFVGQTSIGDIIKIPQIYASVVLSTKPGYSREQLPRCYLLIEQLARQKTINSRLTTYFLAIVGQFPVGFGVCYIPENDKGQEKNHYEYAIVAELNPVNAEEPLCKVVSRNQTFLSTARDERIPASRNLFFPASKQKLMRMDRVKMANIMSQLRRNFTMDDVDNHIPAFWEPHDYFSEKKNQQLWR